MIGRPCAAICFGNSFRAAKSHKRTFPAISPEARSRPRRENSKLGNRSRMRRRKKAHEFARRKVPDLDLRLVGSRRIDRVAVAGEQVAAVGREGDRRQAFQLVGLLICPANCPGGRVPHSDLGRTLLAAVDGNHKAAVDAEDGLNLAGQVGQLLPQGPGRRLQDLHRTRHTFLRVAGADGQRPSLE